MVNVGTYFNPLSNYWINETHQLKIPIQKIKCTANKYLVNPKEGRKYGTDKEQKGCRENKTQEGRLKSNHINNFIKCKEMKQSN